MEVANRHIWMLLLCLLENSYKPNRKTKLQTCVLPFAFELCGSADLFQTECHNCGAIAKVSGMCLIVHGFTVQHEMNYQPAAAKRDSLVTPPASLPLL